MYKKKYCNLLQNTAILLLSLSAIFMLSVVFSYETGAGGAIKNLFSTGTDSSTPSPSSDLTGMAAPFNLVVTAEHGRYGRMLVTAADSDIVRSSNLIQEVLGSATDISQASESDLCAALSETGLFFDYLIPLPPSILAGWFDAEFAAATPVRYLLISAAPRQNLTLYFWDGSGPIYRAATAVEYASLADAVSAISAEDTAADSVAFALEQPEEYGHLAPYTVLSQSSADTVSLTAAVPELASNVDQLLTLLDFNAHTQSRYTQSNGTEVINEAPRTLRIQTDGVILYNGDTEAASSLYHVAHADEYVSEAEAVLAVRQLAEILLPAEALGDAQLYLSGIEITDSGYVITFDYLYDGIPIYFSNNTSALEVRITDSTITSFRLQYRQYLPSEQTNRLLPLPLAINLASHHENAFLTKGYADRGGDSVAADWLIH